MKKIIWAIILSVAIVAGVLLLPALIFKFLALALIIGSLIEYSRLIFAEQRLRWITIIVGALVAIAIIFIWPQSQVLLAVL